MGRLFKELWSSGCHRATFAKFRFVRLKTLGSIYFQVQHVPSRRLVRALGMPEYEDGREFLRPASPMESNQDESAK